MSSRNPPVLVDYMLHALTNQCLLLLTTYQSSRHTKDVPERILAKTTGEKVNC